MKNSSLKVAELVVDAFYQAQKEDFGIVSAQVLHKNRSTAFINNIHHNLQEEYDPTASKIQVFSGHIKNQEFKGRSEYLFDVAVCEIDYLEHNKSIPYIKKCLVQIESELRPDVRESSLDMNKLVMGNAPLKIMVLPNSLNGDEKEHYLKPLTKIAESIEGEFYVIFIPHPKNWNTEVNSIYQSIIYEFAERKWIKKDS